jgi:hypothetical protein
MNTCNEGSAAVRVANMVRAIEVRRSVNAVVEAFMEVRRAYFEQKNLINLDRWLAEWTARNAKYRQLQEASTSIAAAKTQIHEVDPARFSELHDLLDAMNEAERQFNIALDQGNQALVARWLEEWKTRRAEWEQAAVSMIDLMNGNGADGVTSN